MVDWFVSGTLRREAGLVLHCSESSFLWRGRRKGEGGREGGRGREREGGREGGREEGREGGREGGREEWEGWEAMINLIHVLGRKDPHIV